MTDDYRWLDATEQAALVRSGEVKATELVDAAIDRIERLNPQLNAVIMTFFDQAREAAASGSHGDGPLAGVPFLLKDIGATQAGLPVYQGNVALKEIDHRGDDDTVLGARFRDAGLITIGKSNLPELGSRPTTQPLAFGPTANPWDLTRSPAGSSGGSAAAVAAGLVPIAHANDGGGSTRLPASWCGLVGLKASRGRMPAPSSISRLSTELVVSRSVRDTAAALDATQGHTEADVFHLAAPARPYVDELSVTPGPLRIGLLTDGGEFETDPECVAGATEAAALLESMGHHVSSAGGDVLWGGTDAKVNGQLWMAGLTRRVDAIGEMLGRSPTADDIEPFNWAAAERGRSVTAAEWTHGQERQQGWVEGVIDWFDQYDILVTPTSGCPPLRTDELWPGDDRPWRIGRTDALIGRFTLPFNATGQPAISLPLHRTASGLPVGVQLVAKMGRDDLLLQLAARLEEAAPWIHLRPDLG